MPIQRRAKLATAAGAAAAALTLATGLAVAAGLPDQASDTATQHEAGHGTTTTPSTTTPSTTAPSTTTTVTSELDDESTTGTVDTNGEPQIEGRANRPTDTHGYAVSNLATTTDAQGRDKGEAIATLAKSNAQADADETTGTVDADEQPPATRGKSADHEPASPDSND